MKEYEYSFKVESIQPYIKYCEDNNYEKKSVIRQNRIVFENKNNNHIIARITTEIQDDSEISLLDFKNVKNSNENLKISNESIPLKITKENKDAILSTLNVLEFYEVANNNRIRYIYEKNGVKFEIDDYISPKMRVVAIEGIEEKVQNVYNDIKNIKFN